MNPVQYAEQILEERKCNQWFLLFYNQNPIWKPEIMQQHWDWMNAHLVHVNLVAGMGELEPLGNLYHVDFDTTADARLVAYSQTFENEQGISLHPDQYQMLEWSYEGWITSGGRAEWLEWAASQGIKSS